MGVYKYMIGNCSNGWALAEKFGLISYAHIVTTYNSSSREFLYHFLPSVDIAYARYTDINVRKCQNI